MRHYLAREIDPAIKPILVQAASKKEEIDHTKFSGMGMKPEWDDRLREQLILMTDGEPFRMIRTGDQAGNTGLEMWRQLAEANDPRIERTGHNDLRSLVSWPRCDGLHNLEEYILKWEDAVQTYNSLSLIHI